MIVIATDRMYIVSKKIHSIFLDEEIDIRRIKKNIAKDFFYYLIKITFEPEDSAASHHGNSSRSYDIMTVEFKVYGQSRAISVYKDIVSQIREQCPDQVYLDKIAENFLARSLDDAGATEVCETREAEGRNQEILRRAKIRTRRRH